jgi:apolipoprotein N-acyltransferase
MDAITYFGGKEYLHSDYSTPAKQKNLPEQVIKAIQGNIEQTPQVEQTTIEQTVTNETNNN